jgi:hypothetical protein
VTVLKTSETTFRIIDSRSNSNLASKMHLFDFIQPNILNTKFDFQTKEINSYREKMVFEIIDGKLFEQKLCADF